MSKSTKAQSKAKEESLIIVTDEETPETLNSVTVHPNNKMNDLSAKEWIPETISVWTQRGLGANHADAQIEKQHPAPFSFSDISRLIRFFTKSGDVVFDPFAGVGSTLKACAIEGRKGIGLELNPQYVALSKERLAKEVMPLFSELYAQEIILGDARVLAKQLPGNSVDFVVTSPPYWNILHKQDHKAKQERTAKNLDTRYSDDKLDLGNINDYNRFLSELGEILGDCAKALKPKKYMALVVSDFRDKSKYYMFHSQLAESLDKYGLELRGNQDTLSKAQKNFSIRISIRVRTEYSSPIHTDITKHEAAMMTLNLDVDKIHEQDCITGMQNLPDECVDLVIADPPYNLNKDFGAWNEHARRAEWLPWSKRWLDEAKRILKPTGSIFVYGIHHHLCWLQCYLYEIGLAYRRQIIWHYENGFAGYSARTLAAHYEPLLWFSKGDTYTYNPIREAYKSEERLKYKITKNGKVWSPNPEGRLAGDVWSFPTLAGRRFKEEKVDHPTQKPLSISLRIVKHFSNEGELIVIPFAGSGTECLAAKMEHRHFIGFELNPQYIAIAESRLSELQQQTQFTFHSPTSQDNPPQ